MGVGELIIRRLDKGLLEKEIEEHNRTC